MPCSRAPDAGTSSTRWIATPPRSLVCVRARERTPTTLRSSQRQALARGSRRGRPQQRDVRVRLRPVRVVRGRAVAAADGVRERLRRRRADDIDEVDWIGRTPLVDAIQCGRTEVTRMLLDYGADVNWADKAGLTPLHFACLISDQRGCAVAVRWCLDMGASVDPADKRGMTPLDLVPVGPHQRGDAAPRPQRRRREHALRRQLLFWRVARPARFFWIQHASSGSRRCRRPSSAGRKHTAPHRMPR